MLPIVFPDLQHPERFHTRSTEYNAQLVALYPQLPPLVIDLLTKPRPVSPRPAAHRPAPDRTRLAPVHRSLCGSAWTERL